MTTRLLELEAFEGELFKYAQRLREIHPDIAWNVMADRIESWARDLHSILAASRLAVPPETPPAPEPCVWKEDNDGVWETSCGESWVYSDGSPAENNTRFCHGCGHPVEPHGYFEEPEELNGETAATGD